MLLHFNLLSLDSWMFILTYTRVPLSTRCSPTSIHWSLFCSCEWVSERANELCTIVIVCFWLVFIFTLFLLARPCFCCYLFVVLCLFVAAIASVFSFIGMSRISFHFFISKYKWKKTSVWLNVIHFGCLSLENVLTWARTHKHTRTHSWIYFVLCSFFFCRLFLLLLSLLFVLLLFVRWIFIVN